MTEDTATADSNMGSPLMPFQLQEAFFVAPEALKPRNLGLSVRGRQDVAHASAPCRSRRRASGYGRQVSLGWRKRARRSSVRFTLLLILFAAVVDLSFPPSSLTPFSFGWGSHTDTSYTSYGINGISGYEHTTTSLDRKQ